MARQEYYLKLVVGLNVVQGRLDSNLWLVVFLICIILNRKDKVCSSLKCHFDHILCSHLHYSQVNMKAGGVYSNDKAMLNIPVAKIFIADLRQFGLYKVQQKL